MGGIKIQRFCLVIGPDSDIFNKGSYMSSYVLFNLLNKLRKRDEIRGLSNILSLLQQV